MSTVVAANPEHFLWVEKFRPATLEQTILPASFKAALQKSVQDAKMPSFIFFSPSPGTGKTTTALALCHDLKCEKLFINGSTDNSIDTIRNLVTQFATTASLFSDAPIKVVVLDEADRLSPAAQDGLKALIEEVSKNCSFILTCNNKARLIDPLRSRCTEIDFIYTKEQQVELATLMLKRVIEILKLEGIEHDVKTLAALTKACVPDNRKLIHTVQEYVRQYGKVDAGVLALHNSRDTKVFVDILRAKNFDPALKWCLDNSDAIGDDFYRFIYDSLKDDLTDQSRAQIIITLNDYQRHHATVPDRFLHLSAMATQIMMESQFK